MDGTVAFEVPTRSFATLSHIGLMRRDGRSASSDEGRLLSVSTAPEAWRRIARLGTAPEHRLDMAGTALVDVRAALRRPALMGAVTGWSRAAGLTRPGWGWEAAWWDEEDEDWRRSSFATEDEARAELMSLSGLGDDDEEPPGPGGRRALRRAAAEFAEPALEALTGFTHDPGADAREAALAAWLAAHLPESGGTRLVGLWWNERLDPTALSAPRGGLLPGVGEASPRSGRAPSSRAPGVRTVAARATRDGTPVRLE